jgi:hypothetical protein
MGKRFTAFGLDSVAYAARRAGFELSLIASVEPTAFLHEPVNPELRFVDAHFALTRLSPIAHSEFANLIKRNGLSGLRCYINTDPPIVMGEDILRRPIEAIADRAWHGNYLATPDQQNLTGGRFDFGG